MATQVQLRRGNTTQIGTFTGAVAEVTVDTDKKTIVVHDGSTAGGVPLAKEGNLTAIFVKANSAFDVAGLAYDKANGAAYVANTDYTNISATATVYGNSTFVPSVTLTANGRVSNITNTAIDFPVTSVAGVVGAVSNTSLISGIIAVDGTGSGLDADLLDGLQGSSYANTGYTQEAFNKANSANVLAQAAYDKANTVTQQGFVTVTANGTSLVADSNNDTLVISAAVANGIFINADASTDSLDIGLRTSGVASGSYGNSTISVSITVDQFGRITSISNNTITAGAADPPGTAVALAIALG